MKHTETSESITPTNVTGIPFPTNSALLPSITIPLHVPTKTIRIDSDFFKESKTSERSISEDKFSGVTSDHLYVQNTAYLPIFQINRSQSNVPMYIPFIDYVNQIQNIQIVANQPNISNGQTLLQKTRTTTVRTLSRLAFCLLNIVDTYSLSSTNNIPFQTNTFLYTIANPCQTLYQAHTEPNIGPSALP